MTAEDSAVTDQSDCLRRLFAQNPEDHPSSGCSVMRTLEQAQAPSTHFATTDFLYRLFHSD